MGRKVFSHKAQRLQTNITCNLFQEDHVLFEKLLRKFNITTIYLHSLQTPMTFYKV